MSEHTIDAGAVLLCVDTSSDAAVAVCRVGDPDPATDGAPVQVLASTRSGDGRRHAETLVPMIQQVLQAASEQVESVSAVVVGTGPAPFTGLRVGLVTARTFARARGIDAYGVASLDALALAAAAREPLQTREVLVVTDAKRREVYYGRYRVAGHDLRALAGPAVAAPALVAQEHADLVAAGEVFGPGLSLYAETLGTGTGTSTDPAGASGTPRGGDPVDPAYLGRLAVHRRHHGGDLSLTPRYIRRPDVHVATGRERAS